MNNNNGLFSFLLLAMLFISLVMGLMLMEAFANGTLLQPEVPGGMKLKKTNFHSPFPSILIF